MTRVIITDDHVLVSSALGNMIQSFGGYEVIHIANSGKELLQLLKIPKNVPDLILLDISMPIMDGYATMEILHNEHPLVKVLALSMNDNEESYLKMIRLGAHGFVSKTADEEELRSALDAVLDRGCYYSQEVAESLFRAARMSTDAKSSGMIGLTDREKELLELVCTEMTYQQIADLMCLSPKTVDGYRNSLFQKLNAKSRVGLVVYAIRHGYYDIGNS